MQKCLSILSRFDNSVPLYYSKTDFSSAFRILPVLVKQRKLLCLMALHPVTHEKKYFIDLCLPFGSSRSCTLFQAFSDAVKHIAQFKLAKIWILIPFEIDNYLDDFLFITVCITACNGMVREFVIMCEFISCPIAPEKTEFADELMVFLGVLMDGRNKLLVIPEDKRTKTLNLLNYTIDKRKVQIRFIQQLTGMLNFLHKAVVPGHAFTRGMYEYLKFSDKDDKPLKQHHHVWLNAQFVADCRTWTFILDRTRSMNLCRPFVDFSSKSSKAKVLDIYSDASRSSSLGMGVVFLEENSWIGQQWDSNFIIEQEPSIEFLELYALVCGIITWGKSDKLINR